ncbi:MAG: M50 family metallopeptidase [Lachnospiraceae bacterium]|nr:M50 family metallopeptidase [Lachnospiraceae bacterium]
MKILLGILILGIIIVTHEFGHYIIARLNGIEVVEFTIGFGPRLFGFTTKSGTKFSVRLIMLGAACVFDDLDADTGDADIATIIANSSFRKANVWSRIATTLAGPLFNLLLAFVLGLFLMNYIVIPDTTVTDVNPEGSAYAAGIRTGDRIISVNGSRCYLYPEVSTAIELGVGRPANIVYEHEGKRIKAEIVPKMNSEYGRFMIGVTFGSDGEVQKSAGYIIKSSYCYVRYMVKMTFASIRMLFTGQAGVSELAGPVGAAQIVGDEYESAKKEGALAVLVSMLNIALLLSANIGVVNLFPVPAFDGGKLLFLIYEVVRGKPADSKVEGVIQLVGVGLLLILLVVVMYNDIARLLPV